MALTNNATSRTSCVYETLASLLQRRELGAQQCFTDTMTTICHDAAVAVERLVRIIDYKTNVDYDLKIIRYKFNRCLHSRGTRSQR